MESTRGCGVPSSRRVSSAIAEGAENEGRFVLGSSRRGRLEGLAMYRVLLISPGAELKEWTRSAWASPDWSFDFAAGSADALRRLRRRPYDMVVSSPCSAVEEDLALLEEMRHLRPVVRTILLTPHATPEDVIAALRAHVFALFSAPLSPRRSWAC